MQSKDSNLAGIGFIALALLILSLQGIAVRWIGGDYAIMEIVLFRSIIAMPVTLLLFRLAGSRGHEEINQSPAASWPLLLRDPQSRMRLLMTATINHRPYVANIKM